MIKRQTSHALLFALTSILFACNTDSNNKTVGRDTIVQDTNQKQVIETVDSFRNAVDSLANIGYFISGHDSLVISNDPTDFVEMNGIRNCFQNPFNKSDSGLIAYRQVEKVRKFHISKNGNQNGASATIIQLRFVDTLSAINWFGRLNNCKELKVIKMKPKTEIWLTDNHVYFIQSYHDSNGQILTSITDKFKHHLYLNSKI
jgi:hypothetical protein